MLTALGLSLDMIGAVLVGFVVPRYQAIGWGGPIVTEAPGKRFSALGWALLVIGFLFQLGGTLVHR
ncbi:MAG: hypothetical protein ACREJ4_06285 [Candidatus Methylomirabilaceae bacterium]